MAVSGLLQVSFMLHPACMGGLEWVPASSHSLTHCLQVMTMLHKLFTKFDNLCEKYNLYKVETIGDCYMVASGLIFTHTNHARTIVAFADELLRAASTVQMPTGVPVVVRVGIHSGVQLFYTTSCTAPRLWAALAVQVPPGKPLCRGRHLLRQAACCACCTAQALGGRPQCCRCPQGTPLKGVIGFVVAGAAAQQELGLPVQKSPAGGHLCADPLGADGGTTSAGICGCFRVWLHWQRTDTEATMERMPYMSLTAATVENDLIVHGSCQL